MQAKLEALRKEADELRKRSAMLYDQWELVKHEPFDLNHMFDLLGKTTYALNHMLETKAAEIEYNIMSLTNMAKQGIVTEPAKSVKKPRKVKSGL